MILAQISRGICPAQCIHEAKDAAYLHGWDYLPLYGYPLVEAKNLAVEAARDAYCSLLMVEDDILAAPSLWQQVDMRAAGDAILVAETRQRSGHSNVRRTAGGRFLYSGNVFTFIPATVLHIISDPVFQACDFTLSGIGDEIHLRGPGKAGSNSDVYFWRKVAKLDVAVEVIGQVDHVKTPYNTGQTPDHKTPYRLEVFA